MGWFVMKSEKSFFMLNTDTTLKCIRYKRSTTSITIRDSASENDQIGIDVQEHAVLTSCSHSEINSIDSATGAILRLSESVQINKQQPKQSISAPNLAQFDKVGGWRSFSWMD